MATSRNRSEQPGNGPVDTAHQGAACAGGDGAPAGVGGRPEQLENAATRVVFDGVGRGVRSLVHLPTGVEFAGNPENNRRLAAARPPLLGNVALRAGTWGGGAGRQETRFSEDIATAERTDDGVTITYRGRSEHDLGIKNLLVESRWRLGSGAAGEPALRWRLKLGHPLAPGAPHALEYNVGELSFPLTYNTHFGGHGDQDLIYDGRVMLHPFACGYGGYVLAQRLSGAPPWLLMVATDETPLECLAHDQDEFAAGGGWDGLLYVYAYSKATAELLNWGRWYHGHRALVLQPGEQRTFGFDFFWVNSDEEVQAVLAAAGHLVIRAHPGYVVPINHPCTLRLAGPAAVTVAAITSDGDCTIAGRQSSADALQVDLGFRRLGEHVVTVQRPNGRWTNILFNVVPDGREHLAARARFIATKQFFERPGHRMHHAFLMWDAEERGVVTEAPDTPWLVGGSDEGGLADPLVLATKNACVPDAAEIATLETYVADFLFGVLQNRDDYGIRNWIAPVDAPGAAWAARTGRSFNYPHVWNIYYHLYLIARRYGLTQRVSADAYLERAYRTARAFFTRPMHKEHHRTKGNMGEDTLGELITALEQEGRSAAAEELRQHRDRKVAYMTQHRNPYLSELAFDTTGYAAAYWYRRVGKDEPGAAATLNVIQATRHRIAGWPWYASDVRWGWGNSKFRSGDEICFNYMTGLNARALLDAYERDGGRQHLRLGYAALLAVWVLVEPDGTAHDFYGWEPVRRRFDPWTSEMGLALFPAIALSSAYVDDDPELGLIGYGCRVEMLEGRGFRVLPLDAVRQRIWLAPQQQAIELSAGVIEALDVRGDGERYVLHARGNLATGHVARLRLRGAASEATYRIEGPDEVLRTVGGTALAAEGVAVQLPPATVTLQLGRNPATADG
jgi:hypothetical protein